MTPIQRLNHRFRQAHRSQKHTYTPSRAPPLHYNPTEEAATADALYRCRQAGAPRRGGVPRASAGPSLGRHRSRGQQDVARPATTCGDLLADPVCSASLHSRRAVSPPVITARYRTRTERVTVPVRSA